MSRRTRVLVFAIAVSVPALVMTGAFRLWRAGSVVATATFDPGIAPFDVEVRKVPVPVTGSSHFIIELSRGEYVVTSHRVFWKDHTPQHVSIDWPCIDEFTVTFDGGHSVTCDWEWGKSASWTTSSGSHAGLSPYYFVPRNDPPEGCPTP